MNFQLKLNHFALFLLFTLASSTPSIAQWDSLQLPCRPDIINFQVWQGKVLATSTSGTVFESKDQGTSWERLLSRVPGFALNPADQRTYWFYDNTTLLASTYSGASAWNIQIPFAETYFRSGLAFSNDTVYVFNGQYLHWLVPQIWTPVPVSIPPDFYINRCYVFGKHIWADNYALAIHSSDGGATWDTVATDVQNRLSLCAAGDTILLNYFDDQQQVRVLAKTTDQGQTWTTANQPDIATVKGGSPFLGYNESNDQAWFSWNGLTDWQVLSTEFLPKAIAILGGVKIVGQQFGVQVETNGQWLSPLMGVGIPGEITFAQTYIRKANDVLLFGGDSGGYGLFKRPDGSAAWTLDSKPYFADRTVQRGNQLIGCGKYGTYRAQLGGPDFNWALLNAQTGYLFETNDKLYLGDPGTAAIYRSDDEGQSWTQTGTAPNTFFLNSFVASGGKFFMLDGADLMVSENEGQSWVKRYTFQLAFDIPGGSAKLNVLNGQLFLSHVVSQQLLTSQDEGQTFTNLTVPLNPVVPVFRLRVYGDQLFFGNGDGKLYHSNDLGQSWKTIKPPYQGFDFDPGMIADRMLVDSSKIYLFDPAQGAVWTANLSSLGPSPCDAVFIDWPALSCNLYLDINVLLPGMQYTWYEDGIVVQQSSFFDPDFPANSGSTYKLVISDPVSGCSVSGQTTVKVPVANVQYRPIVPCEQEFDTLDLSGSSHGPGIQQHLVNLFPTPIFNYNNNFDAQGQPSNPKPPVVKPGWYLLQLYDSASKCYATDTALIKHEIENPIADLQTTFTSCGQSDGMASVQFISDPALTTIGWSTGASGASTGGLKPGWYSVTVSEHFCSEQRNFEIEEDLACKVKIRGQVWKDEVYPDCVVDNFTQTVKGAMLHLMPDDIYTYTDAQGFYEFVTTPGDYTVEFPDQVQFDLLCPDPGTYSVSLPVMGSVSETNNFFVKTKPVKNLGISVAPGQAVPGFPLIFTYWVSNLGDAAASGVAVTFKHDPNVSGITPSYAFSTYDAAVQTAVSDNIYLPKTSTYGPYVFSMQVPTDVPVGTVLHFSMDITPVDGDFFPADNHVEWSQTVVSAFDPNDKRVSPGDTELGGKIFEEDSLLHYMIRFQNTGNHPATTVEIRDTLDEHLDVTSIQPGGSSHAYLLQYRFEGHNVLILSFENIYLPDSSADAAMSQGFVAFSIKRKPGLPVGTRIHNRAGIFFDFNAPVLTNTVESVLSGPVGVKSEQAMAMPLRVFPNPTADRFTVELPQPATADMVLRVVDFTGRVVLETKPETGNARQTVQAGGVPNGLYYLQVTNGGTVLATTKFIKQ
ncbi:MAG: T9SS type A sorting domain-containing protein [Lewinellaceae bacterium]|nr:T9SS type A sorting domain-containing protein [Lewinellaceae bacterium]